MVDSLSEPSGCFLLGVGGVIFDPALTLEVGTWLAAGNLAGLAIGGLVLSGAE